MKKKSYPNLFPFVGLLLGSFCLVGAAIAEGQAVQSFFSPAALLVVVGGSLSASLVSLKWRDRKHIFAILLSLFQAEKRCRKDLAYQVVGWSREVRRSGSLALEPYISQTDDEFLAKALQGIVDGLGIQRLDLMFSLEKERLRRYYLRGEQFLESLGGYCPTFGIIGTVMVLVSVLGDLEKPELLAAGVAEAFIATFYGIIFANLLFIPLAHRVERDCLEEIETLEMIATGFRGIETNEHPTLLQERLEVFLPSNDGHALRD